MGSVAEAAAEIFMPILLPPARVAPRLAASMIPGPPPVQITYFLPLGLMFMPHLVIR